MAARAKTASAAGSGTSNSQTTQLTPNSNCVAVGSGDSNNSTAVQFFAPPNGIAWWSTSVGAANTSAQLGADQGNAVVTFQKGLTVTYRPLGGGGYNVTLSGNITDGSTVYTYTGQVIYQSTGTASPPVMSKAA
jgi:hypothetical protein